MDKLLNEIIERNRKFIDYGEVADYIPALKKADKDKVGLGCVYIDGNTHLKGDVNQKFTLQSISKVFSLIIAIEDNGYEYVFNKVGTEGTDEAFNSLYKLDFQNIKGPVNPMVNGGAILTTSLIKGEDKFNRILNFIRKISKNPNITYNKEVYLSESKTGDKNKAMAYLMRSRNMIEGDVNDILDTYFKQCSIEVDLKDLLNMSEFILNRGRIGYEEIVKEDTIKRVIAIMAMAGMYNSSGEYAMDVGMPSKSGVSGGIMGISPGRLAVVSYSPALDRNGNSIVGVNMMKDISNKLNLSIY